MPTKPMEAYHPNPDDAIEQSWLIQIPELCLWTLLDHYIGDGMEKTCSA
jgi:hypothetical protein